MVVGAFRMLFLGTIIIDAKWQKEFALHLVNKQKWPDMRGFIDYCHSSGIKVLLWLQAWTIGGLSDELCIKNNGKAVCMDPPNPDYREIMEKGVCNTKRTAF